MSIYKPVSSVSRRALSVGGSIISGVTDAIGSAIGSSISNALGNSTIGKFTNSLAQTGLGIAKSEVTRYASNKLMDFSQKLDDKVRKITRKGLKTFGLNVFDNEYFGDSPLHHVGNLSFKQMWENYKLTNPDELSRKNFYLLEINDRSNNAPTSGGDRHSQFNLLATTLSFNSFEINGEGVPIGSVELDKPTENARTTLTLTMLDDRLGTIKRWAEQKSIMVSASDGTFLPPSYYVFDVRVVFGTNIADDRFYEQVYTMRIQSMSHELSRTEQGLEELQLTMVQTDTCMPHWII